MPSQKLRPVQKSAPGLIILEKMLDRHERSGIAVQWNGVFITLPENL